MLTGYKNSTNLNTHFIRISPSSTYFLSQCQGLLGRNRDCFSHIRNKKHKSQDSQPVRQVAPQILCKKMFADRPAAINKILPLEKRDILHSQKVKFWISINKLRKTKNLQINCKTANFTSSLTCFDRHETVFKDICLENVDIKHTVSH